MIKQVNAESKPQPQLPQAQPKNDEPAPARPSMERKGSYGSTKLIAQRHQQQQQQQEASESNGNGASAPKPIPKSNAPTDNYGSAKLIGKRDPRVSTTSPDGGPVRRKVAAASPGGYRSMPPGGDRRASVDGEDDAEDDLDAEFDAIQIESVRF